VKPPIFRGAAVFHLGPFDDLSSLLLFLPSWTGLVGRVSLI
jgi:hypothetical protein